MGEYINHHGRNWPVYDSIFGRSAMCKSCGRILKASKYPVISDTSNNTELELHIDEQAQRELKRSQEAEV